MASAPVKPVITIDLLGTPKGALRVARVQAGNTDQAAAEAQQAAAKTVEQPVIISNMLLAVEAVQVVPALAVNTVHQVCRG